MTAIAVQTDSNEFRFGTQSLRVTIGDTGSNALYPTTDIDVEVGETYVFSVYIKTNGALAGGGVVLRIAQGGTITPALAQSSSVSDSESYENAVNGWTRVELAYTVAEGILTVRPVIIAAATAAQVFWLDGLKFEKGTAASVWAQNIVSKQLVLDQGGVQVDASEGGLLRLRGATGGTRDTISLGDNGLIFGGDTELYSPAADVLALKDGDGLRIEGDEDITAIDQTTGIPFQIGPTSGINLIMDSNEVQSRNNGAVGSWVINPYGGDVVIGAADTYALRVDGLLDFGGTAFPATPGTGDIFYRTDHKMFFHWDGTRWVCVCPHQMPLIAYDTQPALPLASTASLRWGAALPLSRGLDLLFESVDCMFLVASGGTALGASHKWVGTVSARTSTVTVATLNIDSGASNSTRNVSDSGDTVIDATGGDVGLQMTWTKTGTPGDLKFAVTAEFRYIGV